MQNDAIDTLLDAMPELWKGRRGFQHLEIHEDNRCGRNRHQRQRQVSDKDCYQQVAHVRTLVI